MISFSGIQIIIFHDELSSGSFLILTACCKNSKVTLTTERLSNWYTRKILFVMPKFSFTSKIGYLVSKATANQVNFGPYHLRRFHSVFKVIISHAVLTRSANTYTSSPVCTQTSSIFSYIVRRFFRFLATTRGKKVQKTSILKKNCILFKLSFDTRVYNRVP